jgi:hypothetical protein
MPKRRTVKARRRRRRRIARRDHERIDGKATFVFPYESHMPFLGVSRWTVSMAFFWCIKTQDVVVNMYHRKSWIAYNPKIVAVEALSN